MRSKELFGCCDHQSGWLAFVAGSDQTVDVAMSLWEHWTVSFVRAWTVLRRTYWIRCSRGRATYLRLVVSMNSLELGINRCAVNVKPETINNGTPRELPDHVQCSPHCQYKR
jgi:hypothetical protein